MEAAHQHRDGRQISHVDNFTMCPVAGKWRGVVLIIAGFAGLRGASEGASGNGER
jgi:hypothetical protein